MDGAPKNKRQMYGSKTLNLQYCYPAHNNRDWSPSLISCSCQNLLTLDLSWCWDVTDAGLQYIVTKCHNVVDLNLCGLNELLGEPLKELPQEMPKLTYLDGRQCNKVPDNLLEQLAWKMTKLTVLNYYGEQVRSAKFSLERSAWSDWSTQVEWMIDWNQVKKSVKKSHVIHGSREVRSAICKNHTNSKPNVVISMLTDFCWAELPRL